MPTTGEHIRRAEQNLRFAQEFDLATTRYIDWAVTAYFYAALHLVDALLFEKDRIDPGNHEQRRGFVKDRWYLRGIKDEYRELKDYSENARYELITFTSHKVTNVIVPLYRAIEQHVLQQLPAAEIQALSLANLETVEHGQNARLPVSKKAEAHSRVRLRASVRPFVKEGDSNRGNTLAPVMIRV